MEGYPEVSETEGGAAGTWILRLGRRGPHTKPWVLGTWQTSFHDSLIATPVSWEAMPVLGMSERRLRIRHPWFP